MKKLNNNGFVLAETLIVTVFVLTLFSMIYRNFYPVIGIYEQRETYDDVDGKYVAYWVKKIVENNDFKFERDPSSLEYNNAKWFMNQYGYLRLNCDDIDTTNGDSGISMCRSLLKALEVSSCDNSSNNCDIFITHYRIGGTPTETIYPDFKNIVNTANLKKYQEGFYGTSTSVATRSCTNTSASQTSNCKKQYFINCCDNMGLGEKCLGINGDLDISSLSLNDEEKQIANQCKKRTNSRVFPTYITNYINYLPDYANVPDAAKYRVIVVVQHKKALNNYYSFSTMEVRKWQ